MKYKYYIISIMDGNIKGTNSKDIAYQWAEATQGEDFVIDAVNNKWILNQLTVMKLKILILTQILRNNLP